MTPIYNNWLQGHSKDPHVCCASQGQSCKHLRVNPLYMELHGVIWGAYFSIATYIWITQFFWFSPPPNACNWWLQVLTLQDIDRLVKGIRNKPPFPKLPRKASVWATCRWRNAMRVAERRWPAQPTSSWDVIFPGTSWPPFLLGCFTCYTIFDSKGLSSSIRNHHL